MATLQEFREAMADRNTRDKALELALAYAEENADTYEPILGGKSSDELVTLVDMARAGGNDDLATAITIYELAKFERKNVGGTVEVRPELPTPQRAVNRG
jgi:hypothetical protein